MKGIKMWGLLLLSFAAIYFVAVGFLLIKVKPWWGKGLVLIAAILIPNADDWYYRYKLADYCKNEAGFKIYQQISKNEGLVDPATSYGDDFLKHTPVSYVEWPEKPGAQVIGYWRADRLLDGSISKPYRIPQYTALYEDRRVEKKDTPYLEVTQQIVNRKGKTIMGEFKGLFYYGGWYPRALVGPSSLVAGCGKDGQVVNHREWQGEVIKNFEGSTGSERELIKRVFSKE